MELIDRIKLYEPFSTGLDKASEAEIQGSNPAMHGNYTIQEKSTSASPSKATFRKFIAENVVNRRLVEEWEKGLSALYQKYQNFQFESPFKEFNRYPPEFKACLALDRKAVEAFLQHGWDINKSHTTHAGGGHWIDHGTPLSCLTRMVNGWSHPKMTVEKQSAIADMCIFLINKGANTNSASPFGNSLCILIRTFNEIGNKGVEVIKTAIEHGGNLRGALRATLNLPTNTNPEYRQNLIALLLNAGATLDD